MDSDGWIDVARSLGLALAHASNAQLSGTSFQTLRREMTRGSQPRSSYMTRPWMHGKRDGVAVISRVVTMRQTGEGAKEAGPTHSSVVAEIDPPLFAGLRMISRDLATYFGFPKSVEITGHPSLDTTFLTNAFDMRRVREILVPRGHPDRLGEGISHATRSCSLVVKDSMVEALALGATPDRARFDALVDVAASIARELSRRAPSVEQQPLEIAGRDAWQRLAAKLGLSIDPLRWQIYGNLDGVDVSVVLDGSPPGVSTLFGAKFRAPLACSLLLRSGFRSEELLARTSGPSDDALPGFAELDKLLVLRTPHRAQARALLADEALRRTLATEASSSNLVLDEREVVLGRGGFASTREIRQRLEALVTIVDRLTPRAPAAGPFR
jgi:hypothetical protein